MATNWRNGRLQAGRLRHRIDIVQVSPVQDSCGGFDLSADIIFASIWASVEALSGHETLAMASQVSTTTHQVIIRYFENPSTGLPAVTAAHQVWFNGRQFQITSVLNPDERNKMLCLQCVEINDSRQQITNQPGNLN